MNRLVVSLLISGCIPLLSDQIAERMQEFVDQREISGAVTLVASKDRVLHLEATGKADPAGAKPIRTDSLFWIASMTKPITATAIMMLQEEGKLSIEDPASKYIPELAQLKTAGGKPVRITLRHMLTHTSGMGEATPEESKAAVRLADLIPGYVKRPVTFEPGTQWKYCQSGINSLARIVEIVSGLSFPEFLHQRLFRPLQMKDTTFYLREDQMPRLVTPAARQDGKIVETHLAFLYGMSPASRERYPAGHAGIFSTAPDYARFTQMILNGGSLLGRRYLSPESVRLMTTVQTGDLTTGFTPGNGWGLGWCIIRQPQGVTAMLSPGSYGHGGAYGTQAWIDPRKERVLILMVQRSNFPNSDASEVRRTFQENALRIFGQ